MSANRLRLLGAAALGVALVLTGCSAPAPEPTTTTPVDSDLPQGDGSAIRVISQSSGTSYYPPYVMDALNLDEKYGFSLELVPSAGTLATTNLFLAGGADVGPRGWVDIGRMRENGDDMVGVTPWLKWANLVLVRDGADIDSLADLEGMRVGTFSRVSPEWFLFVQAVQNEAGFDLATESEIFESEPALLAGLLQQGQIDAALVFYNVGLPLVLADQASVLVSSEQLGIDAGLPDGSLSSYWAFDSDYVAEHPDNVRAFYAAMAEAMSVLQEDDDIWVDMLATQGVTDPELVAELRDWTRNVITMTWPDDPQADVEAQYDLFVKTGGIEAVGLDEAPEDVVDTSFGP